MGFDLMALLIVGMICPPSPPILGGTGKSHSPPELGDLGGNAESAVFTDSFPDSATPL